MSDLQLPDYSDDNESWREPRIIFTGHVRGTAWPQCGDPNSIFVQIGDDGDDYRQRGLCTNCDLESEWGAPMDAEDRKNH